MVRYNKIKNNISLKTGDLLLFSHRDNCTSCCNCLLTCFTNTIKCCTKSKYSHSAIILEKKHAMILNPVLTKENYYILQSSYESFPDAENQQNKLGVEIVGLNELIKVYEGKIFWRHIDYDRNNNFVSNLINAHSVVHNRPYDINPYDWLRAAFKIEVGPRHRLDTFWCSALVAFVYTKLGFFPANTNWTLVSPVMLSDKSSKPKFINCSISKEIRVL